MRNHMLRQRRQHTLLKLYRFETICKSSICRIYLDISNYYKLHTFFLSSKNGYIFEVLIRALIG